jgi:hypothetical protein
MARLSRAGLRSVNTPGGIRTRSLRIESPASFQVRPRGRANSANGAKPNICRGRPPCRCRLCRRRPPAARLKRLSDRSHHGSAKPSRTSIGYSDGRDRTCASRLTVARLTARPHRNEKAEAAGFEPAERPSRPRGSSALPFHSAIPPLKRKERESNPQGRCPPVFETGYRTRWQSFRKVTPAGLEPACGRLRVGCSAV